MSSNKSIKLRALIKSKGLLFPTTPEEIAEFEKHNNIELESPANWENPVNIILQGKEKLVNLTLIKSSVSNSEVQNLAMAARDGKEISEETRRKMNADRENAKKKQ